MDFELSEPQRILQRRCLDLAADFALHTAAHDRDASHPVENYDRLRAEGFLALSVPAARGGAGAGFLDHTIAYEALGQGCPSTALAFNMQASVVVPLLTADEVTETAKQHVADLVVRQGKLIGGNFSEPTTTSLIGERPINVRARRVEGGYRITGRKMFASMLGVTDYTAILAYPDEATNPAAGMILLIPRDAEGRRVEADWNVLGMRATRSDSLVLEDCFVTEDAAVYRSHDMRPFRAAFGNWFWASYTPVYLGVAQAAFDEMVRAAKARRPQGYAQSLAYHPDVRRHAARLGADLEAARLITYRSAWLLDREGSTPRTLAAMYQAKYMVGTAATGITRTALTLGGAHGIFKGGRMEQLFRDGALAAIQPPPEDFCLHHMGLHELGLNAAEIMQPLRPE